MVSSSLFHSQPWWTDLNDFAARHQSLLLLALVCSLTPVLLVAAFSSIQLYAQLGRREMQLRRRQQREAEAAAAAAHLAPSHACGALLHGEEDSASPAMSRVHSAKPGARDSALPLLTSTAHSAYATFAEQHRRTGRNNRRGDGAAKR